MDTFGARGVHTVYKGCATWGMGHSTRSRIHERTISFLRFLTLEVSVYNVYITNQFQTTFARGGGGGGVNYVIKI
jgi:hypothetical protein